jgi:hypothetical protein
MAQKRAAAKNARRRSGMENEMIRKIFWMCGAAFFMASAAAAQTPFNATLQCAVADPNYALDIGDADGHRAVLQKTTCTITQAFMLGAEKPVQDTCVFSGDLRGNRLTGSGTHVLTMENGDIVVLAFKATIVMTGGAPKSSDGTFQLINATGKLKGISGSGTLTGEYGEGGSVTVRLQGAYSLTSTAEQ